MSISYVAPRSDKRRLHALTQVVTVAAQDQLAGREYIKTAVVTEAGILLPKFKAAMNDLSEKLSVRMQAVAAKDKAISSLDRGTRDAWESMKRRIKRQGLDPAIITYYGLSESGEVPARAAQWEILQYGSDTLEGDAETIAAGFVPLKDPDAAELQLLYDAAKAAYDAVPMADRAYDLAQEAVADMREPVDKLFVNVVRDMRYNLSSLELDKESERRVMRSYGFTFQTGSKTAEEIVADSLVEPEEEIVE